MAKTAGIAGAAPRATGCGPETFASGQLPTNMNIKRWSDEKLDKELAFAEAAMTPSHRATITWLNKLYAEERRREK